MKLTHESLLHLSSLSIVFMSFSSHCFGKINVILMDIILKLTDCIYKCLIDDNAVLVVLERIVSTCSQQLCFFNESYKSNKMGNI